jgi:predicted phosphodiesterase
MELTYKYKIALEYCEKYPEMPTRTLGRLIWQQNKLDFTETTARTYVIRFRGEGKSKSKKEFKHLWTSEKTRKDRMAKKFLIPETDYKRIEPFKIPKLNNRILVLSDIHLPYHDEEALSLAIEYGIKKKVNAIYLNGDTLDFYQASRFIKDRRLRQLAGELEMGRDFLKMLKGTFNCPIYYKIGNHEERWEHYLMTKAPELLGIADFELKNLLRFGEYGVTEVKGKQIAYAGKLALLHGHEFGHSVFSPVNPARGLYMRAKNSSARGHHHQTSEHSEKSLNGNVVKAWSIGCLCGLSPEYFPYNKWNHGFAYIETDGDDYDIENLSIINGKVR